MGYHVFKRWPMDIYRISCATWVFWWDNERRSQL